MRSRHVAVVAAAVVIAVALVAPTRAQEDVTAQFALKYAKAKPLELEEGDFLTMDEKSGKLIRIRPTGGKAKMALRRVKEFKNARTNDIAINYNGQVAIAGGDFLGIYDHQTGQVTTITSPDNARGKNFFAGVAWSFDDEVFFTDAGASFKNDVDDGVLYKLDTTTGEIFPISFGWVNPGPLSVDPARNMFLQEFGGAEDGKAGALFAMNRATYSDEVARGPKTYQVYNRGGDEGLWQASGPTTWGLLGSSLGSVALFGNPQGIVSVFSNKSFKKVERHVSCQFSHEFDNVHSVTDDPDNGDLYVLAATRKSRGVFKVEIDPRFSVPDCSGLVTKLVESKRLKDAWTLGRLGSDWVTRSR